MEIRKTGFEEASRHLPMGNNGEMPIRVGKIDMNGSSLKIASLSGNSWNRTVMISFGRFFYILKS
ncbi:MAG: hypothetical protein VST70_10390 [Nitrospirota bacterium]|nr:hypothetical protein [Nitrospirota bacterium]